ncbi:MAG TPA: LuxR C-terminal-related transcriptional regulator [Candidatus Acidoferrales bacterium]|nr:LuxR C-terminal-related transcriptional regulator [Candidatus Acidoferrales bacterium]
MTTLDKQAPADLRKAEAALASGDWRAAAEYARACIAGSDDGEAHVVLATALWCGYDTKAAIDEMKLAYRRLVDTGSPQRAAWVACWSALEEAFNYGDRAVANGWFGRAARLLEDLPECAEHGWLLLYRTAFEGDYERLAEAALEAEAIARRHGDRDLELSALAERGLALVILGDVGAGMRLVDSAMAGVASGDTTAPLVMSDCFCVTLAACESAHDYARAEEWCRAGLAVDSERPSGFLKANCLATYGWILGVLGRTSEGEARLRDALDMFDTGHWRQGHRMIRGNALVKLADLQRRRGDPKSAAQLIRDCPETPDVLRLRGELALDAGDTQSAVSLAKELATMTQGGRDTTSVLSHQLTIRAAAAAGDVETAHRALAELDPIAERIATPPVRAWLALSRAAVDAMDGKVDEAVAADREAARLFANAGTCFDAAQARRHEAAVLRAAGRSDEAAAALDAARQLLGETAATPRPAGLTAREAEVLRLVAAGLSNAAIAQELNLSPHTVHRHVASVLRKLDVPTRAAAAAEATRLGLS